MTRVPVVQAPEGACGVEPHPTAPALSWAGRLSPSGYGLGWSVYPSADGRPAVVLCESDDPEREAAAVVYPDGARWRAWIGCAGLATRPYDTRDAALRAAVNELEG